MNIQFFYEEINPEDFGFSSNQQSDLKSWIKSIINKEGFQLENLNYILCSDNYLLNINQEYLDHDTLTDIITFDNSDKEQVIDADIFISMERVKENSLGQATKFIDEFSRVLVHGVLHLIGWSDKTDALKKEMRKKEDACLSLR